MKELRVGAKAPRFELRDKEGVVVQSAWAKSDFTVVYFYPKDNTPGCTIEAKDFSDSLKQFRARKSDVIGVSGGDDRSKAKFCEKHGLKVCLVSDTEFSVSQAYGVYGPKKFMGRTFNGIHRKTFVVDSRGIIAYVFAAVKPEGHAEEVLKVLDQLRHSGTRKVGVATAGTSASKRTPRAAVNKKRDEAKKPSRTAAKSGAAIKRTKR